MDLFSIIMFVAVGIICGHVANKTTYGKMALPFALALGLAGALTGGISSLAAGMKFYDLFGPMIFALCCATLCLLICRQLQD
jgi:uncharacterized membrane protein YeaQ/YmgE (transglycosylase-associated protein family)